MRTYTITFRPLLVISFLFSFIVSSAQIITTVAGNGSGTYSGDGGLAINAGFFYQFDVSVDAKGNLYIADANHSRIRKVDATTGVITTIAGNGTSGYSGDGGPAINAQLWSPQGIAIDKEGNLYVSDRSNQRIRKIILSPVTSIPSINITPSANNICFGEAVTFMAAITNGGITPLYQWKVNGVNVGANSPTYTSSILSNNDMVTCELTRNEPCNNTTANSNAITMAVTHDITPKVTISSDALSVCEGTPVTFTATNQSGNPSPAYQWQVAGANVGINSTSFTTTSLPNGATVQCIMTVPHCLGGSTKDISDPLTITVHPAPVINFDPATLLVDIGQQITLQPIISGTIASYEWTPAWALINSSIATPLTIPLTSLINYQLKVTTTEGCEALKNIPVNVFKKLFMPNSFSPNGDGINDVFRVPPGTTLTLEDFSVFDRWGHKVFTTTDLAKGWNGMYKGKVAPVGQYVYIVKGTSPRGDVSTKGTIMLLR